MRTTYLIIADGRNLGHMTADFAEASSPILLDGKSTPFQVADAWHNPHRGATLLLKWADDLIELDSEGEPVYGEMKVEQMKAYIGQMPGGSHYYVAGPDCDSLWPKTKFDTFEQAFDAALKLVPREYIICRDAKIKPKVEGD